MRNVLLLLLVLIVPMGALAEVEETYDELMDSIDIPITPRFEDGVIIEIDLASRMIQISGYDYHVGPAFGENIVEVSLYGTSFGSFELLSPGMNVEVEYLDLGRARVALAINELSSTADVEH